MNSRILIIEDNAQNRYLAAFILKARGHLVIEAETGPDGLRLASEHRPDLILLDIQIPGMDGHAVTRALKADTALKQIPIVAVTSFAMLGDREKCFEAGAEGYIEKPINPSTFAEEIESYLR